jgi:hypothetical protein
MLNDIIYKHKIINCYIFINNDDKVTVNFDAFFPQAGLAFIPFHRYGIPSPFYPCHILVFLLCFIFPIILIFAQGK